jgi:ABC-type multidrug transport system fused ATPase/permease subunit
MVLIAVLALWLTRGQDGFGAALPVLGALALGAQRLLPLMQLVFNGWTRVATNVHALDDVLRVLEAPVHGTWLQGAKSEVAFNIDIAFRNVAFGYTLGEPPVLNDVNFVIPKGSRVGIIGKTGSGKSTLVDLLMGLLDPSEGSIEVDGWRLDDTTRRAWQQQIAHVPQAIFLADATIAENIAFGVDPGIIDLERVRDAARQAEISDFIETLPHTYDTSVGERGVRQRQRVGIARALYKQASVLVFDEATSALDVQTEAAVIDSVERLDRALTVFIIAHRLSTVERCNIILNVSVGRLELQSGAVIG